MGHRRTLTNIQHFAEQDLHYIEAENLGSRVISYNYGADLLGDLRPSANFGKWPLGERRGGLGISDTGISGFLSG